MHFRLPINVSHSQKRLSRLGSLSRDNRLNRHLFDEAWQSAIREIECHPHETRMWSNQPGFFEGEHESRVLPIHVACSLQAPLRVVQAIVEAYSESLGEKESSFERLPIHVACHSAAPANVIEYLAQKYVAGTVVPDNVGRLPLHYACSNGASIDVVSALLRANPSSAMYEDHNGWLPLHVAVRCGASTEVIRKIVTACPAAVVTRTKKKSTPMDLAESMKTKNRDEVIALLSDATMVGCDMMHRGWSSARAQATPMNGGMQSTSSLPRTPSKKFFRSNTKASFRVHNQAASKDVAQSPEKCLVYA
ncbi:hypothetical protein ACHAWF_014120 [Thalassiosira exigua]